MLYPRCSIVAFWPCQAAVADGWSATRAAAFLMPPGSTLLKYRSDPSCHPPPSGTGLTKFGSLLAVGVTVTDTSGNPGFSDSTFAADVATMEKSPTRAKSLLMAVWVRAASFVPLYAVSCDVTVIFRPLIPPVELT